MLLAAAFLVAPIVPAVIAAATTARRQRATVMRLFIEDLPESGGPVARSARRGGCAKTSAPLVGQYHMPRGGSCHTKQQVVNTSRVPAWSAEKPRLRSPAAGQWYVPLTGRRPPPG